jgi:enoyl-CoA hydratase
MTDPIVRVEKDGAVACVTMNRPEALNALNRALRAALVTTFTTLAEDEETEVVIFTGAGRAFTAGLDLKELGGKRRPAPMPMALKSILARSFTVSPSPSLGPSTALLLPEALSWPCFATSCCAPRKRPSPIPTPA